MALALAGKHLILTFLAQHCQMTPFVARLVHHALLNAMIGGETCLVQWHRSPPTRLVDSVASDSDEVEMVCSPDSGPP